jgi:hypothetical protein
MAANKASSLEGLRRKSTAPSAMACRRSPSCARAVTKTIGIRWPAFARYRCNSKPSIPGIRTSTIRHLVSSTSLELRKSKADKKDSALRPNERTRYRVESAIEASSSTMQTSGSVNGWTFSGTLVLRSYGSHWSTLAPDSSPILLDLGPSIRLSSSARGTHYGKG